MRKLVRRLINERKSVRKIAITISVHNAAVDCRSHFRDPLLNLPHFGQGPGVMKSS
jgi:hypothetical protein